MSGKLEVNNMLEIVKNILDVEIIKDNTPLNEEDMTDEPLIFNETKGRSVKISDRISHIMTNDTQNQTIIHINFPCYKNFHKYNHYTMILCGILANGISGRLVEEIRIKQGLTYSIESDYMTFTEFGIFSISLGVQHDKVYKACDAIFTTLNELIQHGITEVELNRVKNQHMTEMMITFQKQLSYYSYHTKNIYYGYDVNQLENIIEEIYNINISDINNIIRKICNYKQTYIVMLGSQPINLKYIKQSMMLLKE
jgi:predicted Zn-dependent peptidase